VGLAVDEQMTVELPEVSSQTPSLWVGTNPKGQWEMGTNCHQDSSSWLLYAKRQQSLAGATPSFCARGCYHGSVSSSTGNRQWCTATAVDLEAIAGDGLGVKVIVGDGKQGWPSVPHKAQFLIGEDRA